MCSQGVAPVSSRSTVVRLGRWPQEAGRLPETRELLTRSVFRSRMAPQARGRGPATLVKLRSNVCSFFMTPQVGGKSPVITIARSFVHLPKDAGQAQT